MVHIETLIIQINSAIINHETTLYYIRTEAGTRRYPNSITVLLNSIRQTVIVDETTTKYYNPIISIFSEEYEDAEIYRRIQALIQFSSSPFHLAYSVEKLSECLTRIHDTIKQYISTFEYPTIPSSIDSQRAEVV